MQVPYTPHAGAHELHDLFYTVQPKRVHPLIKQSYNDDQMTVISEHILNPNCEIVGYDLDESIIEVEEQLEDVDNSGGGSFLELSDLISGEVSQLSSDVSGVQFDIEPISAGDTQAR